jgi:hypothetical protein
MATAHYIGRAQRPGVHIGYGVKVTQLLEAGGRISGVHTTAGPVASAAVVVACGVWTPYLAQTVGMSVPIMPVVMSELETEPVMPRFPQTLRAFGFGVRQRPSGRTVVSAGLNAKVKHGVSLADFHGLRYWLPRAVAFRKHIGLHLDTRRIAEQLRHRSTLGTQLVPMPRRNPPSTVRSSIRHSYDSPHSSLTTTGPVPPAIGRASSTSRQTVCRSSTAVPDLKV